MTLWYENFIVCDPTSSVLIRLKMRNIVPCRPPPQLVTVCVVCNKSQVGGLGTMLANAYY